MAQAAESLTAIQLPEIMRGRRMEQASATNPEIYEGSGPCNRQPKIIKEASCRCQLELLILVETKGHTIDTTSI
jgi:hypothetical protein